MGIISRYIYLVVIYNFIRLAAVVGSGADGTRSEFAKCSTTVSPVRFCIVNARESCLKERRGGKPSFNESHDKRNTDFLSFCVLTTKY